jgi:hypothetical protein
MAGDQPQTPTGRALAGWVPPSRRAPFNKTVRAVEVEAAREALTGLRARVLALAGDQSAALALIDEVLHDLDGA